MTNEEKLKLLKEKLEQNKNLPLRDQATQLVFGEGNPNSEIYFLGEAPGFHEDRQGRPFVGLAGKLLTELLGTIGLERKDIYISNIVRFRPPENRDPLPEEIAAFAPYVDKEIEVISPKVIVTLGRFSMNKFIPDVKISQVHGKPRYINWKGKEIIVIPMYHPAAALRAGAVMKQLKEDFLKIPSLLKKEPEDKAVENNSLTDSKDEKPKQLDLL